MEKVRIKIEGCEILCDEGESILNVARANGIFIPAICYLSCCSPTLACKMCMVEADGKRVYACNAKVKEGMEVIVNTPEIEAERVAIMQTYDVNHPLQCGVCDKSGECELQNYTHYVGVREQKYALRDDYKALNHWGKVAYDPNLCIVCERCVTLCKDKVGKAYIKTIKRDGEMPDKEYKETMPKDAFGVWNKAKKSLIGPSGSGDCKDCGECASVCPVGALGISHFQYRSNAWELEKIPSTCVHCGNGCPLTYEVKQEGIGGGNRKVYRVTSDWNFATLCPAGRLAFESNHQEIPQGILKDKSAFNAALAAFKEAKSIHFAGNITNEEALILQLLKQKYDYRLVCEEVFGFQEFLGEFARGSGGLGQANQKEIVKSDFVVCFGGAMSYDMPVVTHSINNAMKQNKGATLAYFHTMRDCVASGFVKPANLIEAFYKPESEEAFALLLASVCIPEIPQALEKEIKKYEKKISKEVVKEKKKIVKVKELGENGEVLLDEEGKEKFTQKEEIEEVRESIEILSSELVEYCLKENCEFKKDNLELDLEALRAAALGAKSPVLVVGLDVYRTKNAKNIARILAFIEKHSNFKILLLPPSPNAMGISLLCELSKECEGYTIGYNAKGDFRIGVERDNALIMPYLIEQEGTFVNVDKRVVPLNSAIPYGGYELNDLAKELGLELENTVDYTQELPLQKGFRCVEYDSLNHGFLNDGSEIRGYLLEPLLGAEEVEMDCVELGTLETYNLYARNAMAHFSKETLQSQYLDSKNGLQVSVSLASKLGVESGDCVEIAFGDSKVLQAEVVVDEEMESEIAALGVCGVEELEYFPKSRYAKAQIKVVK